MIFSCYLSLVYKSKRSIYKSLNTSRPHLFYSDGFAVITFCALGLPAHSRGGGTRNTRARSCCCCCCWCWWCLLIMLSYLSHSGGNRGTTFASNYFNLRPRVPLWTDRQTPWHNYCGIEMTLKRRVWGKGEFNSFQLSKPTTFCKCLISIMTRRCLHCEALLLYLFLSFFLYLNPLERLLGTFLTWLCLDSGLGGNEVETLGFVCSCVWLCLFSCQTALALVFPYPHSLPCPISLLPPASVSALNLSLAVIALPTVFKSH